MKAEALAEAGDVIGSGEAWRETDTQSGGKRRENGFFSCRTLLRFPVAMAPTPTPPPRSYFFSPLLFPGAVTEPVPDKYSDAVGVWCGVVGVEIRVRTAAGGRGVRFGAELARLRRVGIGGTHRNKCGGGD